jgi:hypothetical protein
VASHSPNELPQRWARALPGPCPSRWPPRPRKTAHQPLIGVILTAARRLAPRQRDRAAAPPRCSRNAPLALLIAPAEPDPEDLPGACQLWSGSETAAQTCPRAAYGLHAAAALRAAGALSRCQRMAPSARALWLQLHPYSCSVQIAVSVRCTGMFGGAGGAGRGVGRVHTRGWLSDLNGRQFLSF